MLSSIHRDTLHNLSAEELVFRAKGGSSVCFEELVERFGGRLHHVLMRKTGNAEDAEDLVQETFVKAYQNLHRYEPRYQFSTWLFTIGMRLAISHYRKAKKNPALRMVSEVESVEAGPEALASRREESENLWQQARRLPADQYDALWLRYAEELPVKEIAMVMNKSRVNVKVLLYRARMNMMKILESR